MVFVVAINYVLCLLTPESIHAEAISDDRRIPVLSPAYAVYARAVRWLYTLRLPRGFTAVYWLVLVYMFFLLRIPHWNMKPTDLYRGSVVVRGLMRLLQN
ncbi:MAG: hypothetical protein HC925_03870 [Coleofasciculaceae cyanobacterium SM2_3_26]|nr:hypothetical protein [Coleofasciculaceae cyanobacterium SM2_3_26]